MNVFGDLFSPGDNYEAGLMKSIGLGGINPYSSMGMMQEGAGYEGQRSSLMGLHRLMQALAGMGLYTGAPSDRKFQPGNQNSGMFQGDPNYAPPPPPRMAGIPSGSASAPSGPGSPVSERFMGRTSGFPFMFGGRRYGPPYGYGAVNPPISPWGDSSGRPGNSDPGSGNYSGYNMGY